MEPHARIHARHRTYHSYLPHHKSLPETHRHTPTLQGRGTTVQLVQRATSSHDSSGDGGINPTIPIAVGICVPIVVIVVTFIWLHRRHVKKIRAEERADPHKSLDFGLGNKSGSSKGAKEMAGIDFEKSLRRGRGLSMDIGSPYLLPPELQNSRESLNSLSRNMVHQSHDPYRPATTFFSSAPNSARNSISHDDGSSTRTGSTMRGHRADGMGSPLVPNAQRMPFSSSPTALQSGIEKQDLRSQSKSPLSSPPLQDNKQPDMSQFSPPPPPPPAAYIPDRAKSISPKPSIQVPPVDHSMQMSHSNQQPEGYSHPASNVQTNYVHQQPQNLQQPHMPTYAQTSPIPQITYQDEDYEDDYYDESNLAHEPPSHYPQMASPYSTTSDQFYTPTEESHGFDHHEGYNDGLGVSNLPLDNRRLSILRPLPPDDPHDTPQQRAQRIRSFYKEYFNEHDARVYRQGPNDYYEDYGQEYQGDGTVYDPYSGQFVVGGAPYAEPITRRAMTPPPRGPPRFSGRHGSTSSSPSMPSRARAFSSASAGGFRGPGPRRHAPPPAPLRTLPTPHLLKEDAFSLPIDFAPPTSIKDQAAGRAPSPKMLSRPFQPQVAIANPLASSFNELPVMPSPHALRRSGTFTALDFAPPPKFRDRDNASDAGSIRSGRSGRSTHSTSSRMQVHNIRAGTYRVSRIPKELVGTANEFADVLKPTWKVGS